MVKLVDGERYLGQQSANWKLYQQKQKQHNLLVIGEMLANVLYFENGTKNETHSISG